MGTARKLRDLIPLVKGTTSGNADVDIIGLNGLEAANPGELSFYSNPRYRNQLQETRATAVLVPVGSGHLRADIVCVEVDNPHLAFAKIASIFHPSRHFEGGIAPDAHIHPDAYVHPTATVMAGAMLEAGSKVGARTVVYPGVYIGPNALVGDDCRLFANVSIGAFCRVGHRVILHPSCVVGADGFGFAFDSEKTEHFKIPQVGIVRIEDDVEIGACSCIDRATFGETVVGQGTKIDNLVQIAHNVKVGPLSLICAQAGVSGSTEMGSGVILAGQVGVVGHIKIGNLVKVGAQSGVAQSLPDGATVSGSPAIDHTRWLRNVAQLERLTELTREVRSLRKRLDSLEKK